MSAPASQFHSISPSLITIERDSRQRREVDTSGLVDSIRNVGIINPIVITRQNVLVAGERRLTAAREAGLTEVPVRYMDELSPLQLSIIELEENIKRQDLAWQDLVKAVGSIHAGLVAEDPKWKAARTATQLGMSDGHLSALLTVYAGLDEPGVLKCGTYREAYNVLQRRAQRRSGAELEEFLTSAPAPGGVGVVATPGAQVPDLGPPLPGAPSAPDPMPHSPWPKSPILEIVQTTPGPPPEEEVPLICEDFLSWAPRYSGPKFNFIHCDFPYGIEAFGASGNGEQMGAHRHGSYDDSTDVYFRLIEAFCTHLDRFCGYSAHFMFWYSAKHHDATLAAFARLAPGIVWHPFPLVWLKSDNAGIAGDVRRHPRHIYETALFGSRGGRNLVKVKGDAYAAPTDKRLHTSTKPEPMLRHFFEMLVDEHTEMLDPTCGSGAALRAAESLGAKRLLGLEKDPEFARTAAQALRDARALRGAM